MRYQGLQFRGVARSGRRATWGSEGEKMIERMVLEDGRGSLRGSEWGSGSLVGLGSSGGLGLNWRLTGGVLPARDGCCICSSRLYILLEPKRL